MSLGNRPSQRRRRGTVLPEAGNSPTTQRILPRGWPARARGPARRERTSIGVRAGQRQASSARSTEIASAAVSLHGCLTPDIIILSHLVHARQRDASPCDDRATYMMRCWKSDLGQPLETSKAVRRRRHTMGREAIQDRRQNEPDTVRFERQRGPSKAKAARGPVRGCWMFEGPRRELRSGSACVPWPIIVAPWTPNGP